MEHLCDQVDPPAKLLQSMGTDVSPETIQLALTLALAMKDKSSEECQAMLSALSAPRPGETQGDQNGMVPDQHSPSGQAVDEASTTAPLGNDVLGAGCFENEEGQTKPQLEALGCGDETEGAKTNSTHSELQGNEEGSAKQVEPVGEEPSPCEAHEKIDCESPEEELAIKGGIDKTECSLASPPLPEKDEEKVEMNSGGHGLSAGGPLGDFREPSEEKQLKSDDLGQTDCPSEAVGEGFIRSEAKEPLPLEPMENIQFPTENSKSEDEDAELGSGQWHGEEFVGSEARELLPHEPLENNQFHEDNKSDDENAKLGSEQWHGSDNESGGELAGEPVKNKSTCEEEVVNLEREIGVQKLSFDPEPVSSVGSHVVPPELSTEGKLTEKRDLSDSAETLSSTSSESEVDETSESALPVQVSPLPAPRQEWATSEPDLSDAPGKFVAEDSAVDTGSPTGEGEGSGTGRGEGEESPAPSEQDQHESASSGHQVEVTGESFQQLPQSLEHLVPSSSTSSEMPSGEGLLYHQPQVMMDGETPFLVFQPVMHTSGPNTDPSKTSVQPGLALRIPLHSPDIATALRELPKPPMKLNSGKSDPTPDEGTPQQSTSATTILLHRAPEAGAISSTCGSESEESCEGTAPAFVMPNFSYDESSSGRSSPLQGSWPKDVVNSHSLLSSSSPQESSFSPLSREHGVGADARPSSGHVRTLPSSNPFAEDVAALGEHQRLHSRTEQGFSGVTCPNWQDAYAPAQHSFVASSTVATPGARPKVPLSTVSTSGVRKSGSNPFSPPEPPKAKETLPEPSVNFLEDVSSFGGGPAVALPTQRNSAGASEPPMGKEGKENKVKQGHGGEEHSREKKNMVICAPLHLGSIQTTS